MAVQMAEWKAVMMVESMVVWMAVLTALQKVAQTVGM